MVLTEQRRILALRTCTLAGRLLIENGSNMERVNDTLDHLSKSIGLKKFQAFTTLTGIVIGSDGLPNSQVANIRYRKNNLSKVTAVNQVSREVSQGVIGLPEAYARLQAIDRQKPIHYRSLIDAVAAAILSAALMIVFTGDVADWFLTLLIAGLSYAGFAFIVNRFKVQYLGEFFAAFVTGVLSFSAVKMGIAHDANSMIIGSVMPLVPGIPLTNAARDLVSGNLISASTRAIEALLTAVAIGGAIVIVTRFY